MENQGTLYIVRNHNELLQDETAIIYIDNDVVGQVYDGETFERKLNAGKYNLKIYVKKRKMAEAGITITSGQTKKLTFSTEETKSDDEVDDRIVFKRPGNQLRTYGIILFILNILVTVILSVVVGSLLPGLIVVILIAGFAISWAAFIILISFGSLVDDMHQTLIEVRKINNKIDKEKA